jgi:two-component sensor histidine kinase
MQDKKGFIWVYTAAGLSRFDGYNFKWYRQDKDDLPLIQCREPADNIVEDSTGKIWAISLKNGANVFDPESDKITIYKSRGDGIEPAKRGWHLDKIPDSAKITNHGLNCFFYVNNNKLAAHQLIYVDSGTRFLYITEKSTCWLLKNETELQEVTLSGKVIRKYTFSAPITSTSWYFPKSNICFQSRDSVYSVSPDFKVKNITESVIGIGHNEWLMPTTIPDVIIIGNNIISRDHGIFYKLDTRLDLFLNYYSSKNEQILIATQTGFYRVTVNRNKFRQYSLSTKLSTNYGNSYRGLLVVDSQLWAMNEYDGVRRYNIVSKVQQDTAVRIHAFFDYFPIIKSLTGNVFFGRLNYICELGPKGIIVDTFSSPFFTSVWSLLEVEPGKLLIGTSTGLAWLNTKTRAFARYSQNNAYPGLEKSKVLDMCYDEDRHIWLATESGFYELGSDYGVKSRYSSADTGRQFIPSKDIYHFYQDKEGVYWLATHNGLVKWDRKQNVCRLYTNKDGLSNDNIYSVFGDKYNRLWLSSDYGIMQFNKSTGSVISYTKDDGITDNEFNRKSHFQDQAGNIYFGSLNGITAFNPDDFPVQKENDMNGNTLAITSLTKFDGRQNKPEDYTAELVKTNKIKIMPDDRYINIEFALLNYSNTRFTNYYWRIEGIDTGWIVQHDRNIRLTRLPYGTSLLHIKARESSGAWSKNDLQITLDVVRPIYLRLWFRLMLMAIASFLIYAVYKWRIRLLERENAKLDKMVFEKTNDLTISLHQKEMLLKEIHHRVKNNLQIISSLLRQQSGTLSDHETKKILMEAQNRVLAIALIHQKLYQNELNVVEMSQFSSDLFFRLKNVFDPLGNNIILVNKVESMKLNIEKAVPFGLILNELITNSFKYAFDHQPSPYIGIEIEKNGKNYVLKYHDNGKGLSPKIKFEDGKTMGLRLISRLSEQLNGSATYYYKDGSNFIIAFES